MAGSLNWNAKTITLHGGDVIAEGVTIIVGGNRATIRDKRSGSILVDAPDVVAVERVGGAPNERDIRFADGKAWRVNRASGCGCH